MISRRHFLAGAGLLAGMPSPLRGADPPGWQAGVAAADITPPPGIWMAGYAARTGPATGAALPLHAKALALARGGARVVLVTTDLLGVTAAMRARIGAALGRAHGLGPGDWLLSASHTHAGPVVDDQLWVAYDLDAAQRAAIAAYTGRLEAAIVGVVGHALGRLAPARLAFAQGSASFGANRRTAFLPPGPVDPAVPVLQVTAADGRPLAIVFGYACHNTTLPATVVEFHGDYAGVAQREVERRHPGAQAMYIAGCGADVNPAPRGTLALVEQHGATLAEAVTVALAHMAPVDGPVRAAFETVPLPFAPPPGRDDWRQRLASEDVYVRRHARLMLDRLDRDGRLEAAHDEPVQVWRLGGLTLVALGGEVVVDYALRLKREHASETLWVAGYCNDVSCYVPSLRVLQEGGYEGGGAMLYYGRPGAFDTSVEQRLIGTAARLLRRPGD